MHNWIVLKYSQVPSNFSGLGLKQRRKHTHIFFHENNSYIQMRNEFMISMQTGPQSTKNNTGLTMFDMHK